MIDVMLAYEEVDVPVSVPAVPRVGERILIDDGLSPVHVVTSVEWCWEAAGADEPERTLQIWVFLDPVEAGR